MGAFSRLVRRDDGVLSLPVRRDARCREHGVVTAHKQALAAEQTNSLGHDNDVIERGHGLVMRSEGSATYIVSVPDLAIAPLEPLSSSLIDY